ncbi:uncharacterized protein LOC113389050 [Ctenocephalides felis]|uniref:uncharacterized protein LOC113389050 n=1 Tax=Ctenocephalides felis TaxID=7515 RepID=UPI000E6E4E12|nr:uncharacterized protein LOC113389050 [Ctenocephalides felis]
MAGGHHQHMDEDEGVMDCSNTTGGFVSSSSLSSSDSEAVLTNESDREGDDELTDFPGNETMASIQQHQVRTNSGHEKQHRTKLLLSGMHNQHIQLGQILPSAQVSSPVHVTSPVRTALVATCPMDDDIMWGAGAGAGSCSGGDGSLGDVSSDPVSGLDVREIRAGCRRIREERPGFTVLTSANELLSRFLQDRHQTELRLGALDAAEIEKLRSLAAMYSLDMTTTPERTILTKTSNTMQAVKVEQTNLSQRLLTDFKRRCYSSPGHKHNQPDSDNN